MARSITEILDSLKQTIIAKTIMIDVSDTSVVGSILYAMAAEIQRTEFIVDDFMSRYGLVAQLPPTGPTGPIGIAGPTGVVGTTGPHNGGPITYSPINAFGVSKSEEEPQKEPHSMTKIIAPWKVNE